jgi:hypothetical protein
MTLLDVLAKARLMPIDRFSMNSSRFRVSSDTKIQGDSEISLGKKKPVIGDDEKKSWTKHFSYKSFFVFKLQMIENLVKIASTLLS